MDFNYEINFQNHMVLNSFDWLIAIFLLFIIILTNHFWSDLFIFNDFKFISFLNDSISFLNDSNMHNISFLSSLDGISLSIFLLNSSFLWLRGRTLLPWASKRPCLYIILYPIMLNFYPKIMNHNALLCAFYRNRI